MRNRTVVVPPRLLFLLVFTVLYLEGRSQTGNACGVSASFTPAGDSVVAPGTFVSFINTSTGAATYQWFVNDFLYSTSVSYNYYFPVGTTQIKLVAKAGNCTDTVSATYFCAGIPYNTDSISAINYGFSKSDEVATAIDDTREGSFVIGGYSRIYLTAPFFNPLDRAYVVKTKPGGCVEWSRMINDTKGGTVDAVLGCADSAIVVCGGYNGGGYYVTRFNKSGTRLWQNSYTTQGTTIKIVKLAEDGSGNFYGVSNWGGSANGTTKLIKFDGSGTVIWSRSYNLGTSLNDYSTANGLTIVNQQVYISGSAYFAPINGQTSYTKNFIIRIDCTSGQMVWVREYIPAIGSSYFDGIKPYGSKLIVSAYASPYNNRIGHSVLIIDDAGNFVKGTTLLHQDNFANNVVGYFNNIAGFAEADTAGNIYLLNYISRSLSLQPYVSTASYFIKLDSSFSLKWGRNIGGAATRQYTLAALNNRNEWGSLALDAGLVEYGDVGTFNYHILKIKDPPANYAACSSEYHDFDFLPLQYSQSNLVPATDVAISITKQAIAFPFDPVYSESRYTCPDFIDSCLVLKVTGPASICNLSQTYTYKVFRNKKCNLPVQWETRGAITIITQNDSLIKVKFTSFGTCSVAALLLSSCNPRKDSVSIVVASRTPPLNLGSDTSLCPGNSIQLHAGPKFVSYLWQNSSVDSVLTITSPGNYWVKVTDSCGNGLSDTIKVIAAASVPISIGPDRTKCNSDTLHLDAPSGFLNYTWSNNYNINSITSQSVIVNPLIDTAYYIRAEKTPGCFAYDTVHVTVHQSPPINLGSDKSFCLGDSAVFDAGAGFESYAWGNGQASQQVVVKSAGQYAVTAKTVEGCKSFDTVKVLSVYPLPVVVLDKNNGLCLGETKTLNAGSFASYRWSTGATTSAITVSGIGGYAVRVTDANGCNGSDSTSIAVIYPLPSGFLPLDTAICSYGTLQLKASGFFNKYLWSNGNTTPAITVTQPGLYWLQVRDGNSCVGSDSILINPRECLTGFYVPSAFTPNGDGKNDHFQPMLFGKVRSYRFSIYNRWGQLLFYTKDAQKGWDGRLAGVLQSGVFVWTCTYQFEGEEPKTEKGTLTLIR